MFQIENARGYIAKCCFDKLSEILKIIDDNTTGPINSLTITELTSRIGLIVTPNIAKTAHRCLAYLTTSAIEYSDVYDVLNTSDTIVYIEDLFDHTGYCSISDIKIEIERDPDSSALQCYEAYLMSTIDRCSDASKVMNNVLKELEKIK